MRDFSSGSFFRIQFFVGKHHSPGKKRQHADRRLDRLGLQQVVGFTPIGVGEAHAFGADARVHPAPDRLQVSLDQELAAGGVGDGPGDRAAQRVQPECKKEGRGEKEEEEKPADPLEDTHIVTKAMDMPIRRARFPSPLQASPGTTRAPFPREGCRSKRRACGARRSGARRVR
jgi:hypothetical protein